VQKERESSHIVFSTLPKIVADQPSRACDGSSVPTEN
ncbi:unnamed protein product, partial [Heterotrigona itama]